MEYRVNYVTNTVLSLGIQLCVQAMLWIAVYESRSGLQVAGMNRSSMLVYIACSVLSFSLVRNGSKERETAQQIRSGGLNAYLLKPVSHGLYTLSLSIAERLSQALFVLIPGLIVLLVLSAQVGHSLSPLGMLYAIPILICGALMNFLMGLGISYLAFWIDEVWTFHAIKDIAMSLLSGMMFPLSALASPWREWSSLLPFQYLSYVPASLMNGSMDASDVGAEMLVQAVMWTAVCSLLVWLVWKLGLRRYSAFGG